MMEPDKSFFPWSLDVDRVYTETSSDSLGLSFEEAEARSKKYGRNELVRKGTSSVSKVLVKQFASPLIFILIGAAVLTILLKEWVDTAVILLAIVVNAALGFYQEYKAERTLEKLIGYIRNKTYVVREGKDREIDSSKLVPGDVVRLSLGMRVPADARIISENNLSVDEAVLTGESLPVQKDSTVLPEDTEVAERLNMIFGGSLVVEGYATAIVTSIGRHTEIGRIAELVAGQEAEPTPLQKSLKRLAWIIFAGIVGIVVCLFFLGLYRGESITEMLLLSAAVTVGSVPEGLPIALTVILTAGVARIAGKKGIIRSLSAAETLGSTTLVMTDKTGTLTEAKMQFTGILTKGNLLVGDTTLRGAEVLMDHEKEILSGALLATDAVIENPEEEKSTWHFLGRAIETNIASAARDGGLDVVSITKERRISLLPFNSTNKFSVSYDKEAKRFVVLGAPDILLARSDISEEERIAIEEKILSISAEGKRLVGVAYLPEKGRKHSDMLDPSDVTDLEFLGLVVLYDPVRKDAGEAVRKIESYGARVVMVTGDLKGTAMAIASEIGWSVDDSMVLTGAEIKKLSDEELSEKLSFVRIFARVTPEDKLRIGKLYQKRGEIVAMTGDGVNDAPSLKIADIGIAPGSGSDVAKGVADLVMLDDNFKIIVFAIEEGRRVIANIRKAFVYMMSNSLNEVIVIGGSLLVGLPLPLTALQIIWVNFFTESLPALSYAFEENRDVVHLKKGVEHSIFNKQVAVLTVGVGIFVSLLLFFLYMWLVQSGMDIDLARTLFFACFSSYILAVAFSFKSLRKPLFSYPLFDNKAFNWSLLFATAFVASSFVVPFFRSLLGLVPIPLAWLWLILGWLVLNMVIVEGAKKMFSYKIKR